MTRLHRLLLLILIVSMPSRAGTPQDWIGKACPPLRLDYLGGYPELKGKVLVLEFLNLSETGAAAEAKTLDGLYQRYSTQGVEVITIGAEEDTVLSAFRAKGGYKHHFARDAGGALRTLLAIPQPLWTLVVDRSGTVAWTGHLHDFSHQALKIAIDGTETKPAGPLQTRPTDFFFRTF